MDEGIMKGERKIESLTPDKESGEYAEKLRKILAQGEILTGENNYDAL